MSLGTRSRRTSGDQIDERVSTFKPTRPAPFNHFLDQRVHEPWRNFRIDRGSASLKQPLQKILPAARCGATKSKTRLARAIHRFQGQLREVFRGYPHGLCDAMQNTNAIGPWPAQRSPSKARFELLANKAELRQFVKQS